MDWKSILKRKGEETVGKILPMDEAPKSALGWNWQAHLPSSVHWLRCYHSTLAGKHGRRLRNSYGRLC